MWIPQYLIILRLYSVVGKQSSRKDLHCLCCLFSYRVDKLLLIDKKKNTFIALNNYAPQDRLIKMLKQNFLMNTENTNTRAFLGHGLRPQTGCITRRSPDISTYFNVAELFIERVVGQVKFAEHVKDTARNPGGKPTRVDRHRSVVMAGGKVGGYT